MFWARPVFQHRRVFLLLGKAEGKASNLSIDTLTA